MTKLVKEYLKETGNTNFVNMPINGAHLQYIHWLENKIQALSLGGVVGQSEQLGCRVCGGTGFIYDDYSGTGLCCCSGGAD